MRKKTEKREDCLPSISVIIPTLNEESNIDRCLQSIFKQEYPIDKIEVIVVDGMSSDNTVGVAKQYPIKILFNKYGITGYSRKLGVEAAKGEIIAFIDADNELPQKNWFKIMVSPLINLPNVAGTFPLIWSKREHPAISRCYALMQANPIITFVYSTGKSLSDSMVTEKNYFPLGGNGFLLRRSLILKVGNFKPIVGQEDVDLTYRIAKLGFAFVFVSEAGIYHLSHSSFSHFLKKMYRRIFAFIKFSSSVSFQFIPENQAKSKFLRNVMWHMTFFGALLHTRKGIREDGDSAWLYYPIIVFTTILLYAMVLPTSKEGRSILKYLF